MLDHKEVLEALLAGKVLRDIVDKGIIVLKVQMVYCTMKKENL